MTNCSLHDKQTVLACYAQSLCAGHTLLCKVIKHDTVCRYLDAVSKLFQDHPAGLADPTVTVHGTGRPRLLKQVLNEHRRWEAMPNRREPVTKGMLQWIFARALLPNTTDKARALADWCVLGIYFGFRLAEYLQTQQDLRQKKVLKNKDGRPQAFIEADILFYGPRKVRLKLDHNTTIDPKLVDYISVRWRYQKNQQNGETKFMARNDRNLAFCTIRAALRILHRAAKLHLTPDTPLAVYSLKEGKPRLLSHKDMESLIRAAAKAVYNITSTKYLQRFSCHSIRVGACVMLHCAHFSDTDIQFELRWRSASFKDYLRNVPRTAGTKRYALLDFDPDEVDF